jgi:hypothetical protein
MHEKAKLRVGSNIIIDEDIYNALRQRKTLGVARPRMMLQGWDDMAA